MNLDTICNFMCENCTITLAVGVVLFIIVISRLFGKGGGERKLEERLRDLTYDIERLRTENIELRKKKKKKGGGSFKEEVRNVMVTGKSIKKEE